MKTRMLLPAAAVSLALILATGCGEKKTESGLSPEDKKRFGYVGMPMPPEAREAMQKSGPNSDPPAAATAPAATAPAATPAASPAGR